MPRWPTPGLPGRRSVTWKLTEPGLRWAIRSRSKPWLEAIGKALNDASIGSAKTNFGHLEAASGIAGLMKVVLALEHEEIPRILHFRQLNPEIRLEGTEIKVADRSLPWTRGACRASPASVRSASAAPMPMSSWRRPPVTLQRAGRPWSGISGSASVSGSTYPQKLEDRPVVHTLLGARLTSPALQETVFENSLGAEVPEFLGDHQVGEEVLLASRCRSRNVPGGLRRGCD